MTKLALCQSDEYVQLRDELEEMFHGLQVISAEVRLRFWHAVGKKIASHPLYKKHGKGNGEIVATLAADIKKSKAALYDSVLIAEQYPRVSTLIETFANMKEARRSLRSSCSHQYPTEKQEKVITYRICANCKVRV